MFQQQRPVPPRSWLALAIVAIALAFISPTARAQPAILTGEHTYTASTVAVGNYPDGEGWFIEDYGAFQSGPLHAVLGTSAALSDGLIRGHALVEAHVADDSISITAEAQAYVGPGMVIEMFTTSASLVTRILIEEDTPFFIRRTGTLPASFTPVTGAIDGATLRAGTYDVAGFAWASRHYPGTITLSGTFTIVLADCIPDWDDNGEVASADISAYLTDWIEDAVGGGSRTDLDGDGAVSSADISTFLTKWVSASLSGC